MTGGKWSWQAAGGSHNSASRRIPHDEALVREMAFRLEHPEPEAPHRLVDYFAAPLGFPQFPVPEWFAKKH
jgi:hypothetical protein